MLFGKQYNGSVPGIHFKVEQHFQIVQDSVPNVIRVINDDDRRLTLFEYKAVDLILDDLKIDLILEEYFNAT